MFNVHVVCLLCLECKKGVHLIFLHISTSNTYFSFTYLQNDQSTGDIKVIGGDDLSTLTGKVSEKKNAAVTFVFNNVLQIQKHLQKKQRN